MTALNLTDQQVIAIRQAVANKTKTKNQIAAEYGIGERSIRNLLNGYSYSHVQDAILPTKPNKNGLTPEKRQEIVDLYAIWHSMYAVAEKAGVSRNTIAGVLKDFDITSDGRTKSLKQKKSTKPPRQSKPKVVYQPKPLTPQKAATLQKLINAKWKPSEITEMLNISRKDTKFYIKNGVK